MAKRHARRMIGGDAFLDVDISVTRAPDTADQSGKPVRIGRVAVVVDWQFFKVSGSFQGI
jgi:hypothetical protein